MSDSPQITGDVLQPPELRILLLGPLRLALHVDEYRLPCPPDGSQGTLWALLVEAFPVLERSRGAIRIARNDGFLDQNARLHPGDELALIPPVSGG